MNALTHASIACYVTVVLIVAILAGSRRSF